ncbi:hypothetical protein TNCV_4951131 [Trichonephila clavipes]|nr:hypothetical protein TNCV_4951131 [Trichonephila clavipes]
MSTAPPESVAHILNSRGQLRLTLLVDYSFIPWRFIPNKSRLVIQTAYSSTAPTISTSDCPQRQRKNIQMTLKHTGDAYQFQYLLEKQSSLSVGQKVHQQQK